MRGWAMAVVAMGIASAVATAVLLDLTRSPSGSASTIRVGFFPNLTHGQALYGLSTGLFASNLSPDLAVEPRLFNAGPTAVLELLAGHVDIIYVGAAPTLAGLATAGPDVLRVVAGGTSGGALFVVRPDVDFSTSASFGGHRFAAPQLGNTQDVALRHYLKTQGHTTVDVGGDVEVIYAANPEILLLFQQRQIDGAWVPEPWATRLVAEGGGRALLDERSLWPGGEFVTTQLVTTRAYLDAHGEVLRRFLSSHVEATLRLRQNATAAEGILNGAILNLTGRALANSTVHGAMPHINFTYDPVKASLVTYLDWAMELGVFRERPSTQRLYDLRILNSVLQARGLPQVV